MSLPRDRERDLERLLDAGGGEFGAMYRRLSRLDPPRRLDRAVLGEAARAVHGRAPRRHRWLVGLGSAAGIVLAAGVAWQVGHDPLREPSMQPMRDTSPMVVPVEPITERAGHRRERANTLEDAAASTEAAPAATASRQPPTSPPVAAARRTETKPDTAARMPQAKQAPVPPAPAAVPFPAEAETLRDSATTTTTAAPAAGAAKADAVGASAQERSQRARSATAPAPSSSAELRRDLQLSPDDWLAHVRLLLEQGRRQQAGESLRLFRRVHPDRHVPDDLRVLLD